jgi:hypothetical protein
MIFLFMISVQQGVAALERQSCIPTPGSLGMIKTLPHKKIHS